MSLPSGYGAGRHQCGHCGSFSTLCLLSMPAVGFGNGNLITLVHRNVCVQLHACTYVTHVEVRAQIGLFPSWLPSVCGLEPAGSQRGDMAR